MATIIDPESFKIDENVTQGLQMGYTARQALQEGSNTVSNPAAVIVPAVLSFITSVASLASSNAAQKRQNRYNEEMVNKQNEYNSPAAQMERYRQAGINPYLAMSAGGISSGSQEHIQEKGAEPGLKGLNVDYLIPLMSLMSQMQMNKANIAKADADARLKTAQAMTEETRRQYLLSIANKNDYWTNNIAPAQLESIQAATDLTREKIEYLGPEAISRINLNYVKADYEQALIDRCSVLNGLTKAQTAECYNRCKLYQAEIQGIYEDIKRSVSQRDLLEYDKALKEAQRKLTEEQAKLTGTKDVWYPIQAAGDAFESIMGGFGNLIRGARGAAGLR